MPHPHPRRPASLPRIAALALVAAGLGAAGPALEYAPEAEAAFLLRCGGPDVMSHAAAACRRVMEGLQATLGYEAFLEQAADWPRAVAAMPDQRVAAAAPPPQ